MALFASAVVGAVSSCSSGVVPRGGLIGWRWTFGVLAVLAVALAAVAIRGLPQLSGEAPRGGAGLLAALCTPGIAAVNPASVTMVVGFYVLYTYIAPFVDHAGLG
ncbi:hypothetical protein [Kitasatospora sp. NPDC091207]|uniref:hypothetical protein n=1 Tax=Kitasatospora sp. NPDC091207 TaxID=3364083 RepID=UPI00382CE5D1